MEITFNEIKIKEIISTFDGRRLGRATDIVFSKEENRVLGLVVPGEGKFLRKSSDIFIPIENIERIGDDVILIKLEKNTEASQPKQKNTLLKNPNGQQISYIRFKKTKIK